jgi:hypothetical protein
MAFNGEVMYHAIVSNDDVDEFMEGLATNIKKCGENYAEVQYQPVIQNNGKVLFTAYVIGRARE